MKAKSNVLPKPFEIDKFGGEAHISLFVNPILEEDPEEGPYYSYDYYKVVVQHRDEMEAEIAANYSEWVEFARGKMGEPAPETDKERIAKLEAKNAEIEAKNAQLEQLMDAMLGVSE